jgi:hypothetical protein
MTRICLAHPNPIATSGSAGFENSFEALPSDATLLDACKHLGTMNVHRIPVLKDNKLCNFITQVRENGMRTAASGCKWARQSVLGRVLLQSSQSFAPRIERRDQVARGQH